MKDAKVPTPWGTSDMSLQFERGCVWYNTPSHGGLRVTYRWANKNLSLPAQNLALRWGGFLWYEEDCQVDLVFFERPDLRAKLSPSYDNIDVNKSDAEKVLQIYYPQYFSDDFRQECMPLPMTVPSGANVRIEGSKKDFFVMGFKKGKYFLDCRGARYSMTKNDMLARVVEIEKDGEVLFKQPEV